MRRMDELIRQLGQLAGTTQKLEKYVHQLKSENLALKNRIESLNVEQQKTGDELSALQDRYEANKLVKGLVDHADQKELKEKIDSYLKEIDICLNIFGDPNLVGNTVN